MRWKWHSAEDIVGKLACVRAHLSAGKTQREAIEAAGISVATYHRWRSQFENLDARQVSLIKQLSSENTRLRHALAELEGPIAA